VGLIAVHPMEGCGKLRRWYKATISVPLPILNVNVYLADGDPPILVDCATMAEECRNGMLAAFDATGVRPELLVITHFHPDHAGLAGWLEDLGLSVAASVGTIELMEYYSRGRDTFEQTVRAFHSKHGTPEKALDEICNVADWSSLVSSPRRPVALEPGECVAAGLVLVDAPGHCYGGACLWDEAEGVFLANDQVLSGITPHIGYEEHWTPEADPLREYKCFLNRLRGFSFDQILPGHGEKLVQWEDEVRRIEAHHSLRERHLLDLAGDEVVTAYETARRLFPGADSGIQLRLAITEAMAHLQYLVSEGLMERREEDGMFVYKANAGVFVLERDLAPSEVMRGNN
jgi:glyoxylase-like metal-dependent hydrolase (beta-lactamase superfamily II)